jgi:hypothetical protein
MGQTQLVYKVGRGTMGFIGENLGRAKGLMYLIFFLSHNYFYYYEVLIGIRSG